MAQQPRTAGEGTTAGATGLIAWLTNLVKAAAIAALPAAMICLDVALGPQFIDAWTESHGFALNGLGAAVPWVLSVAPLSFASRS